VTVSSLGDAFRAEAAIVTLPLGVLKAGDVRFDPELPASQREAIRRLGVGVLDFVFLEFPRAFWPDDRDFIAVDGETTFPRFFNRHRPTGAPVLAACAGAEAARRMERRGDGEAVSSAMAVLRRAFGSGIPDPAGVIVTRWAEDPWARGSYSHVPVGGSAEDRRRLAEPAGETLFFAGEASDDESPGTLQGAYRTGIRQARRVAERHVRQK
jgi:monoamine oxidase